MSGIACYRCQASGHDKAGVEIQRRHDAGGEKQTELITHAGQVPLDMASQANPRIVSVYQHGHYRERGSKQADDAQDIPVAAPLMQ